MIGYYSDEPNSQTLPFGFEILYPEVYDTLVANNFRGDFITNVGLALHPELNEAFENAATAYVPDLKVISVLAPEGWPAITPDLGRSDHAAFWLQDMPALMLTDGSEFRYPYYHSPYDTVGNLDFTFMSDVVKATVAAVAELAELSHSSFETADIEVVTSASNLPSCDVQIFPNPNSDFIQLNFKDCQTENLTIDLFNVEGRKVYSEELSSVSGNLEIAVNHLPTGTYVLSIEKNGQFLTKKVLVNH